MSDINKKNEIINKTNLTKKNFFYDIFWKILVKQNIKRIFGLPGGPIDSLLSNKPNKIIWTNIGNELQNGFTAQVYGEYTNSVGYLFVTAGPGISTAISALQQSIYEEKPLIIVSTYSSSDKVGEFQIWNIKNVANNITDNFFYIKNHDDIFIVMKKSYDTAKKYNTGVILLFEKNIFIERMYEIPEIINTNEIINKCDKNNKLLLINSLKNFNSKNTLLVIGRLNPIHYSSVIQFIRINNLPFVTTWKGRFNIKNYNLSCGRIGTLGKHSANYALYNATHLLVLGNISGGLKNSTKNSFSIIFTTNKNIISLCYNKKFALQSSNDIYEINNLPFILENLQIQPNNEWVLKLKKSNVLLESNLPIISKLEKFAYIASIVYKNNNLTIPVSIDVGNNWYAIGKYMDIEQPNCFESATTWASIGIAISSGIAIHYATNKPVWVFIGDGGLLFSSSDLLYLLTNKHLPITVTIFVNNMYGAIMEDLEFKKDVMNKIIEIPNNPILNMLPNSHIFYDENKYYKYLNNNYYSDKLRFIIIMIPNTNSESIVYKINADKEYEENLKNDRFNKILNTKMIKF